MEGHDIGSEIRDMISGLERDNPELSQAARIKRAWNKTIDPRIAEHITAVFVVPETDSHEVIIYVDDAIWATELNMQVETLKLKLNIELAKTKQPHSPYMDEQVQKLKFVVSKEGYKAKTYRFSTSQMLEEEERAYKEVEPIALSQDEIADLQQVASMIDNDELRERAYAAAKANLEWQKGLGKLGA